MAIDKPQGDKALCNKDASINAQMMNKFNNANTRLQ